jgi:hypothetical protein
MDAARSTQRRQRIGTRSTEENKRSTYEELTQCDYSKIESVIIYLLFRLTIYPINRYIKSTIVPRYIQRLLGPQILLTRVSSRHDLNFLRNAEVDYWKMCPRIRIFGCGFNKSMLYHKSWLSENYAGTWITVGREVPVSSPADTE